MTFTFSPMLKAWQSRQGHSHLFKSEGSCPRFLSKQLWFSHEAVGWHHRLSGHEFEQTPGELEGQGGLACCSPWGRKESDMT